jgi:hypothetical protein
VAKFEILPGLPAYGPEAEPFSATGQGKHREGFVVRFAVKPGNEWIGNFQPGYGGCSGVFEHPDGLNRIVISSGQGYVIDPQSRRSLATFGADIVLTFALPELKAIVFGNGLWFEAIGPTGHIWRSDRISWDGMENLVIDGLTLRGLAYHYTDQWKPFSLNLTNGEFTGGSYDGPNRKQ